MRTYRVTLKYPDGTPMFIGTLSAEEVVQIPSPHAASPNGAKPDSGERMTEPQKRYLFRLLAAQKIEGKTAEEHLKRYFQAKSLAEITRQAASEYIDALVKDRQDAES